jgi:hypothetical protein
MSFSKVLASVVADELVIGAAVLPLVPFLELVSRGSYFLLHHGNERGQNVIVPSPVLSMSVTKFDRHCYSSCD